MHVNSCSLFRTIGLLAGTLLVAGNVRAAGAAADAFPVFDNYLSLSGEGVWVNGHSAAFQARNWISKGGAGGIENFRYAKDVSKDVSTVMDGHALIGTSDYLAHFNLTKNELGSVDFGYQRFRTFYDGVGGFFPLNNSWAALADSDLHVDRGKFWAQATIALPDKPVFSLRYTNELRNGAKDSTIWGDSDNTGILSTNVPNRKLSPAYLQLGERHQVLETSVKQTIGNTTYELRLTGDRVANDDTHFYRRYPGEVKPYPTPASSKVVPWYQANNEVHISDEQTLQADSLGIAATTETVLSKTLTVRTGLSYNLLNSDFGGNRTGVTYTPTASGVVLVPVTSTRSGDTNVGINGGSRAKVFTANVAVDYKPTKNLFLQFTVKGEDSYTKSAGTFTTLNASGNPAVTVVSTPQQMSSRVKETAVTPELDARYTGISNVVLYASARPRHVTGDERLMSANNPLVALSTSSLFYNDITENHGDYTVGANWQPAARLTLRAETFYKDHQNEFIGYSTSLGTRYILGSQFTGVKLTATLKPLPTLAFTTRYVGQTGKMQVTAGARAAYDSMDATSYTFGESVDWTPTNQFYLQGNVNVVFDTINTIYPRAGVSATGLNANAILQNADNDYWSASAVAGFVVTKRTDAQLQYTYYRADNYLPILAATTLPYGAAAEESTITLGLRHKFSDRLIGSAKIGYYGSRSDTTGGFTNYHARIAFVALDYALF
jgi:hypothetical protein